MKSSAEHVNSRINPEQAVPRLPARQTAVAVLDAHRAPATAHDPRPVALNAPSIGIIAFGSSLSAGFPSPADDYIEDVLDLNRHLITPGHEDATFVFRVAGWSMIGAGIFEGDEVIVDRAKKAVHKSVVVAVVNGEFTIKRLMIRDGLPVLLAENPHFADRTFAEGEELQIWGVITRVLHRV